MQKEVSHPSVHSQGSWCCLTTAGWNLETPDLTSVSPWLFQPGTHQESPGQRAEPLKGVLRAVGAQPSLDGDLRGAGTIVTLSQQGTVALTAQGASTEPVCAVPAAWSHHDQDPHSMVLQQLPARAVGITARNWPPQ